MVRRDRVVCTTRRTRSRSHGGKSARLVARWLSDGARDGTGRPAIKCDGPRRSPLEAPMEGVAAGARSRVSPLESIAVSSRGRGVRWVRSVQQFRLSGCVSRGWWMTSARSHPGKGSRQPFHFSRSREMRSSRLSNFVAADVSLKRAPFRTGISFLFRSPLAEDKTTASREMSAKICNRGRT